MRARNIVVLILLIFVIGQVVFLFFRAPHLDGVFSFSFWRNMGKVGYVMLLAEDSYVSEKDAGFDRLGDNALHGLIGGLDSYSSYLSDREFEDFEIPTRQSYAGIGAEVRDIDGSVFIMGLNESGGAKDAGFLPGDRIVEVDGENVEDLGIRGIVDRLRGEAGTSVDLGVGRDGEEGMIVHTVERRELSFDSVKDVRIIDGDIGYLSMGIFGQQTAEELKNAIQSLLDRGMTGLIIDLRNNPGGLLDSARENIDLFVPAGKEILTVQGRRQGVVETYYTEEDAMVPEELPLVFLQNRFSASASEIMAGVLQALGRARVVGEVSFGKGSVQSVFQFGAGDGLSLTTARYVLPDGRVIEGVGLEPDVTIELNEEEIVQLSIQSSHETGLSEEEFESKFGFAPIPDRVLEQAIAIIESEQDEVEESPVGSL